MPGGGWLTIFGMLSGIAPPVISTIDFRRSHSALMPTTVFAPGPSVNTVRDAAGKVLTVPDGWTLLSPGDAALTRRVKAAGDHWIVQEQKGRKTFSRGVW